MGVKGEVAWVEGKKGEKQKNSGPKNGKGNHLLAEAGSGACRFWFSHGKGCV